MDFLGIILTFLSTALITLSRVIGDQQRNFRNYLVYLGLLVSGAAVFVTYNNIKGQKERLKRSYDDNEKFKQEVKSLKLKMFALNNQIEEATSSLLRNNDATSIAIAEKLKSSTGELLSANYSTSNIVNELLKEQNDSLTKSLTRTINILRQSIVTSEANLKSQLKETETSVKQMVTNTESTLKIDINNLEEHVDEQFEETHKKLKTLEMETEEDSSSAQ